MGVARLSDANATLTVDTPPLLLIAGTMIGCAHASVGDAGHEGHGVLRSQRGGLYGSGE